jgi:hypothetical protein
MPSSLASTSAPRICRKPGVIIADAASPAIIV